MWRGCFFLDDCFFFLPVAVIEDLAGKLKEHVGLPFSVVGATPANLTEEKLRPLVEAGVRQHRHGHPERQPAHPRSLSPAVLQ